MDKFPVTVDDVLGKVPELRETFLEKYKGDRSIRVMVQYTPPSVRIDIARRVHVVLGRLLNNTSIIMDKFPLTVDDVIGKVPELRETFLEKYKGEIEGDVYDTRDVGRLMAKDDYACCFLTSRALGDVQKAVGFIDTVFKWRKEQGIWDWTDETFPQKLRDAKVVYHQGLDVHDFPILYVRAQKNDEPVDVQIAQKYICYIIEQNHREQPTQRHVVLFDMSPPRDSSLNLDMAKFFTTVWQYFPSYIGYSISYEMPWYFSAPLKAVTYFLPEEAKKRRIFLDKGTVGKYIPEEHLWPSMK